VAIKALLFDFDGTIADSSSGIIASTRYALDKNNAGGGITDEDIKNAIGPPLVPLIERILGKKAGPFELRIFLTSFFYRRSFIQIKSLKTVSSGNFYSIR